MQVAVVDDDAVETEEEHLDIRAQAAGLSSLLDTRDQARLTILPSDVMQVRIAGASIDGGAQVAGGGARVSEGDSIVIELAAGDANHDGLPLTISTNDISAAVVIRDVSARAAAQTEAASTALVATRAAAVSSGSVTIPAGEQRARVEVSVGDDSSPDPEQMLVLTVAAGAGFPAGWSIDCLLYTSPSPRDGLLSRMPSSA